MRRSHILLVTSMLLMSGSIGTSDTRGGVPQIRQPVHPPATIGDASTDERDKLHNVFRRSPISCELTDKIAELSRTLCSAEFEQMSIEEILKLNFVILLIFP